MRLSTRKNNLSIWDLAVFSLLGAMMFLSKIMMQFIPNVHLLTLFIASFTLTYRVRALIPIYVYILLDGIFAGFSMWWLPYVYIWLPLWIAFMIAGKLKLSPKVKIPLYMILCGLHGLTFGIMYAPAQALMFGLNFKGMIAWIIAGLPFDLIQGVSDFASAALVVPLHLLLRKLSSQRVSAL